MSATSSGNGSESGRSLRVQILAKWLVETACHLNEPPVVDAHLQF